MLPRKIAIIDKCEDCPHIDYKYDRCNEFDGYFCSHPSSKGGDIFDFSHTQEWCPLENASQQCAEADAQIEAGINFIMDTSFGGE